MSTERNPATDARVHDRPSIEPTSTSLVRRSIAALLWLGGYQKRWLVRDVLAGITLAAYLIPAAIGDASLARLSPEAGLYACLFAGLVFWLFSSSSRTAITVTSAISLLLGSTLGEIAGGDAERFAALAAGTAILVAGLAVTAWLIKAGALVRFISEGVMVGFKCGVALFLASTQLPKLFGFEGAHGDFWTNTTHFFRHLGETNAAALCVGLPALALLILGRLLAPTRPVALVVVAAGIAASAMFGLAAHGVSLLGEVPQGLPAVGWPSIHWSDFDDLLPLAVACFLLAAVETAAIGRMFATKYRGRFDANQEFLALAVANLAAGLGRGFPVGGGMSQSIVNDGAGARTPLSGVVAASCILVVVLLFSELLQSLPQPVLAAVVLVAVAGLFQGFTLVAFWRGDRVEFVVALATLVGVLQAGLLSGVLIGAIISLMLLIHRVSQPNVAQLGRIPGTDRFSDRERHPENEPIPGVLIFRPESALVYFNVDHVCDVVLTETMAAGDSVQSVVLDLSNAPIVDMQAAHALGDLADELTAAGIRVQVVDARASVRDRLRHEGVDEKLGGLDRSVSLADVVEAASRSIPETAD
jgi:high affinity sulfate transporter 1